MARMGAQLVAVWQFSQGMFSEPCGLFFGCRCAAPTGSAAAITTQMASHRATWKIRRIAAPIRICSDPHRKRGAENDTLFDETCSTVLRARIGTCTWTNTYQYRFHPFAAGGLPRVADGLDDPFRVSVVPDNSYSRSRCL